MRLLVVMVCLATLGCADVYRVFTADPPAFDNRSQYPDQFFLRLWAEVEALAGVDISLEGVAVTIHEDAGDFEDACPDVEGLGCSDPARIEIMGGVGTNFVDVGTEVAHQLGHMHLSGDGRHAHAEWFGEGGVVEQARALLVAGAQ
jgi:hypothetical protein